jgi:hypothetical protein
MCSKDGNRSYPIDPPSSISADMYNTIRDTFSINFNLGQRTTRPIFSNGAKALLDEGSGSSVPSIKYNGLTYKVSQVQVTKTYNTKWIDSTVKRGKNAADITLIFQTATTTADTKYIFISIPLLREALYTSDPSYLQALSGQVSTGPHSLSQLLKGDYAVYNTCLEPNKQNALVLVFYQGLSVSGTTLDAMAQHAGNGGTWPVFFPPTDVTLTTPTAFTVDTFNTSVIVSSLSEVQKGTASTREDKTNAYTCVPLDPDRDVSKDGKLTIDTATGLPKPMNTILAARTSVKGPMTPGEMEMAIAIFLGILISLGFIIGIVYFYLYYKNQLDMWSSEIPTTLVVSVLFTFVGFLIGALTR